MDTDVLRIFTANYVAENDIEPEEKLELLEFVKVAERDDLLSFLTFGEPTEVIEENLELMFETEAIVGDLLEAPYQVHPQPTKRDAIPIAKNKAGMFGYKEKARKTRNAARDAAASIKKAPSDIRNAAASTKRGIKNKTANAWDSTKKKYYGMKNPVDRSVMKNKIAGNKAKIAGGAAAAAAVAAVAYMAYKRFASKAARACSGRSGAERDACLAAYKKQGIRAQISTLQAGMGKCASAKNPDSCKANIQNKIAKLKAKAA